MDGFGDRLAAALHRVGNPVAVGLDRAGKSCLTSLKTGVTGSEASRRATVYTRFCREIIDVIANRVAVVKPQVAFFEQQGPAGMQALADTIAHAHRRGLLIIADAKRNDIGSTAEAYADGWLGATSVWQADALTISPYLGDDSLTPFVTAATSRVCGAVCAGQDLESGRGTVSGLVRRRADGVPTRRRPRRELGWRERRIERLWRGGGRGRCHLPPANLPSCAPRCRAPGSWCQATAAKEERRVTWLPHSTRVDWAR